MSKSPAPSQSPSPVTSSGPSTTPSRPSFKRTLGFFGFFAITASMVMTVYEYPSFASSGFQLVFFLIIGGLLWFLPVALCAAEMATVKGWESGGIFAWVGNTLGKRWGFAALFFQWFQITVGFVTMAFFILAALSYVLKWDALYNNPLVMFFGVAAIVWVLTLTQLGGTKYTARISKIGFVGGILVPVAILFVGLAVYFATGGVSQIKMDFSTFVPDFTKVDTLVIFASFILAYMGVEASASHINELKNPARNYPIAMIVLVILTIALDAIGGLAVATSLSSATLDSNLSYGVIEAFVAIFTTHLGAGWAWLVYVVAILLAVGVLAEISAWIVGPSRALLDTAHEGILPASFKKVNKHGVSVKTVVIQAIIVTIWDAVLCGSIALSGGSSSSVGYMTAIGLTVVIYLVGYILFFLGYFVLIFKHKNLQRQFQLPGGIVFKTIFASAGMFITLATLVISFFPSSQLDAQANLVYQITLAVCFLISVALPFIIYGLRHRWETPNDGSSIVDVQPLDPAAPTTTAK
ncbi:MAG: amino acid permease [Raoultibacter sp.]